MYSLDELRGCSPICNTHRHRQRSVQTTAEQTPSRRTMNMALCDFWYVRLRKTYLLTYLLTPTLTLTPTLGFLVSQCHCNTGAVVLKHSHIMYHFLSLHTVSRREQAAAYEALVLLDIITYVLTSTFTYTCCYTLHRNANTHTYLRIVGSNSWCAASFKNTLSCCMYGSFTVNHRSLTLWH